MKLDFLQHNITKLLSQRNGLLVVVGLMSLSHLILGTALLFKSERIILIPPHIKRSFWVEGKKVSKEYLEEMGVYLSKLFLDLSPSSFPYNHETLLKYATPEAYGALKKQLLRDGKHYTSLQLSTHFKPAQVTANPETLEVEVKGLLSSYVAGKHIRDSQETLSLKFTERGGGLLLERVTGGIPHEES
ncbi:MAG: type IV conjugative transfer system protein TraE [Alphaproteobacteria bacterium 41-28]|nr:MAG: type IV conjugative transfer system protein TraE [Alphaproteobacteria bacterium 41-28]